MKRLIDIAHPEDKFKIATHYFEDTSFAYEELTREGVWYYIKEVPELAAKYLVPYMTKKQMKTLLSLHSEEHPWIGNYLPKELITKRFINRLLRKEPYVTALLYKDFLSEKQIITCIKKQRNSFEVLHEVLTEEIMIYLIKKGLIEEYEDLLLMGDKITKKIIDCILDCVDLHGEFVSFWMLEKKMTKAQIRRVIEEQPYYAGTFFREHLSKEELEKIEEE